MGRAPCCDKANVKKGPWSPEEDAKLKSYIEQHGTGSNWIALPQKIGLKRCGKSCRLRWLNYLRPNIKHGGFSEEEDNLICRLYISIGSRWSVIASQLPGRTDNDIKNYWNTKLKKKLLGKQQQQRKEPRRGQPKQAAAKRDHVHDDGNLGITSADHSAAYRITALEYPIDHVYQYCISDEQASMSWKPELGGHASPSFVVPSAVSQQQIFDDPISMMSSSLQKHSRVQALPCTNGLSSTELDEILQFNSVKSEETNCFYGIGGMINENNAATKLENMNWNEVSSLMCPNMTRGHDGMQQSLFMSNMI